MGPWAVVPRGRVLFSEMSGFWVVAGLGRALSLEVAVLTSLGVGASVSKTATVVGGEGTAGVVARRLWPLWSVEEAEAYLRQWSL